MKFEKKIATSIASVIIIGLGLGSGLGIGLQHKNNSTDNIDSTNSIGKVDVPAVPNNGEPDNGETDFVVDANHYITTTGVGVRGNDIVDRKVTINGNEYSVKKKDEEFFLEVPSVSEKLQPKVYLYNLFEEWLQGGSAFNSIDPLGVQEKESFYDINNILPSLSIGVVRIPNDGKIYGGFVNSTKPNTDYEVHPKIAKLFPNGYEIGSFDSDGLGGINFLQLQQLKTLLKYSKSLDSTYDVLRALQNSPTTTRFGFFLRDLNGKNLISLAVNHGASEPSEIGYVPTVFDQPIAWPGDQYSSIFTRETTLDDLATRGQDFPISFYKGFITDTENLVPEAYTIHLDQGVTDLSQEIKEVNLADLNLLFRYETTTISHPLLGQIKHNVDGTILLDDSIIMENGESLDLKLDADATLTIPTVLIKLEPSIFSDTNYATTTTTRAKGELLINVDADWLEYFQQIANDSQVKTLAKEIGTTIRFKVEEENLTNESQKILDYGESDPRLSEIFFVNEAIMNNLGNHMVLNENQFAPLLEDGILKTNLDNPTYFEDNYRTSTKIFSDTNKNKYGVYPFIRDTQVIAYNSDYLPNGLDFSNGQTIADYLYREDPGYHVGNLDPQIITSFVTDAQKNGLLINTELITGGTVWAFDYYADTKKDQQPNQQDIAWKKVTRGNGELSNPVQKDFWSVFADPNLKDDARFQKWVDHIYYSNYNDKYALFNGQIGAIMIDSSWVNEEWKSGTWRTEGTAEEKQAFAEQKIKFQKSPIGMANGWYGAMLSILKQDTPKQELAEMFLNVLSNPNNAIKFTTSTSKLLARKDINLINDDNHSMITNLFHAVADTPTVIGGQFDKLNSEWWPIEVFEEISKNIKRYERDQYDNFYEFIANEFKDAAQNTPYTNAHAVFVPENSNPF